MKNVFFILLLLLAVFTSFEIEARPADPRPVKFIQPDGSIINIRINGDERVHWRETMDGYTLMFNNDGYLTYATKDINGDLQPSGIIATDIGNRDVKSNSLLSGIEKKLYYSKDQVSLMLQVWEVKENRKREAQNKGVIGEFKTVCALVQFPDKSMVKTTSDFEGLMNEIGYSEQGRQGSVKDYFIETSYGQFDLTVKLLGPYTAPKNESYYSGPTGNGVLNCRELCSWLAQAADPDIDYSEFDSDDDGWVDGFHFIFAGYGQEAGGGGNTIWSHSWSFAPITLDGKQLSTYSCSPELKGSLGSEITDIGVIGHEISHAFGSPDYYDVDYSTGGYYDGTGAWDMMAGGSWNDGGNCPAHHNMYQKIQFGWVNPITLDEGVTIENMPNAADSPVAYIVNTKTQREYFVIENRQQKKFDSYIPGHGLLIYRVHKDIESSSYTINSTHPQKLYPVCASATKAIPTRSPGSYGNINSGGCPFPGTKNKNSFTDMTIPSMKSWAEVDTQKPIENISEVNGLISFDFASGGDGIVRYPLIINDSENGVLTVRDGYNEVLSGALIEEGTMLTVTGIANSGYMLDNIKANECVLSSSNFIINQPTTLSAEFSVIPPQYMILILESPNGTVAISDGVNDIVSGTNVLLGTELFITATPNSGYKTKRIIVNGEEMNENSFVLTQATTVKADFESIDLPLYLVTILESEHGRLSVNNASTIISSGDKVNEGSFLTIVAIPYDGYELTDVLVNDQIINEYTIEVNGDVTISAIFSEITPKTHSILATAGEYGSISPEGLVKVEEGETKSFTISANEGYLIKCIVIDGVEDCITESIESTVYTFYDVKNNHEIHVLFAENTSVNSLVDDDIIIYTHNRTVTVESNTNNNVSMDIIDMLGKIVYSASLTNTVSKVDLNKSGNYVVRIIDNGIAKIKKISIK